MQQQSSHTNPRFPAVFLDRDGIINEMVYHPDHGILDSPFTVEQFKLKQGITDLISLSRQKGYKVILVSNQPGVAKGHLAMETMNQIQNKMDELLEEADSSLDGQYYCFHHPEAVRPEYKVRCSCRKPEPGLLLQAADEHGIDLSRSWMIGDGLTDIQAGKRAGTGTILVSRKKCDICNLMDELDARPDYVSESITKVIELLRATL